MPPSAVKDVQRVFLSFNGRPLYRGHLRASGEGVFVKGGRTDCAEGAASALLHHEYNVLRRLDGAPGIVRCIGMSEVGGSEGLVLEDCGDRTLADLTHANISIDAWVDLALQMTVAIESLHARQLIHRNIAMDNFVVDPNGHLSLVDFERATEISGTAPMAVAPEELLGSLAYIAPEQTGRTEATVDQRADLYRLGCVFYNLLIGAPPFASADPLQVIHAHLAQAPVAPVEIRPTIPPIVSDLILKLLAKSPEQRYQGAKALIEDLRRVKQLIHTGHPHLRFELGLHDVPSGLNLAHKLYGRARERSVLREGMGSGAVSFAHLTVVSGAPGVGKSALVESLRDESGQSLWLQAKCDLLRGNIPMAPLAEVLDALVKVVAVAPPEMAQKLQDASRRGAGDLGGVLTAIAPQLTSVVGPQSVPSPVGAVEAKSRLQARFGALLRALAEVQPVVLFIDDLQWADDASLRAMSSLVLGLSDVPIDIIGAFRNEDVGPDHSLTREISFLRDRGTKITQLDLQPLAQVDVDELTREALGSRAPDVATLGAILSRKTGGNPFFLRRFLAYAHSIGLLWFDAYKDAWSWDVRGLEASDVTSNVGSLLAATIGTLPKDSQTAIKSGSCFGKHIDLALLASVTAVPLSEVAGAFWPLIAAGLVAPSIEPFPFCGAVILPSNLTRTFAPSYRFAHDKIQQAAYELLSSDEAARVHLAIGRKLQESVDDVARDTALTYIADQLNRAVALIPKPERPDLAELNARAGDQAVAGADFASALAYFIRGLDLLCGVDHDRFHDLWFHMQRSAVACAGATGDKTLLERLVADGVAWTKDKLEAAKLYQSAVLAYILTSDVSRALASGKAALALLGLPIPEDPEDLRMAAEGVWREVDGRLRPTMARNLRLLPRLVDPILAEAVSCLAALVSTAYHISDSNTLLRYVTASLLKITIENGITPETPAGLISYSMSLVIEGDYDLAYAVGCVAIELVRPGSLADCRAKMFFYGWVLPWQGSFRQLPDKFRSLAEATQQMGDYEFAAYDYHHIVSQEIFLGYPLEVIIRDADIALAKISNRTQANHMVPSIRVMRQLARCLRGLTRGPTDFDDGDFSARRWLAEAPSDEAPMIYRVYMLQVCVLFGDLSGALEQSTEFGWVAARAQVTPMMSITSSLYKGLMHACAGAQANGEARADHAMQLDVICDRFAAWAHRAPPTFQHLSDFLAAERARLGGEPDRATSLYVSAVEGAWREKCLNDESLIRERFGFFLRERGQTAWAKDQLVGAIEAYEAWGAKAKVRDLRERCRASGFDLNIVARQSDSAPARAALDHMSLFKAAQTISSEVELERLIPALLQIAMEAAGADLGALITGEEERPFLQGKSLLGGPLFIGQRPLQGELDLDLSLIDETWRKGVTIRRSNGRESRMSLPLVRLGQVRGLLYLSNGMSAHVFTDERTHFLELLTAQVAISLENARLLADERQARVAAQTAERCSAFLAEASAILSTTFDCAAVVEALAALSVREFADWCVIDILEEGELRRLAAKHRDAAKQSLLDQLQREFPARPGSPHPASQVIRTGQRVLVAESSPSWILEHCTSQDHADLIMAIGERSVIVVPLSVRGRAVGALSLVRGASSQGFDTDDLDLAQHLADRTAMALVSAEAAFARAKEAENRVIRTLMRVLTHDLSNSLQVITLAAKMGVSRRDDVGAVAKAMDRVILAADQGDKIICNIKGTYLPRGEDRLVRIKSVSLGEGLTTLQAMFEGRILEKELKLEIASACMGASVIAEPVTLFNQVLANLVSNAIKFTPRGGTIRIRCESSGSEELRLDVIDDGIGIPSDMLPRLFREEMKTSRLGTEGEAGTGFGMPVVKSFVESYGGHVEVTSSTGELSGTTVSIFLKMPRSP